MDASKHIRVYYWELNSGYYIPHNKLVDGHEKGTICVPAWVRMHILRAEATLQTHVCRTCGAQLLLNKPGDFAQFTSVEALKIIIIRACFRPKMASKWGVERGPT